MKKFQQKKYQILRFGLAYSFLAVFAFAIMMPVFVVNAGCGGVGEVPCNGTTSPANGTTSPTNGTTSPANGTTSGVKIDTGITNPLGKNITDIPSFIRSILDVVMVIGVPIVTLAIIYSGFLFVAARGNAEELTKAKKTLMYTLIGAALLLGSFVIAQAIKGTVDDISSTT